MTSIKQLAAITIFFGAFACTGLHAQTVDLGATIPFDFIAGQAVMPAGDYTIHGQSILYLVRRLDAGLPAGAYVTTVGASGTEENGSPRLEFHRYGNEYFLAAIWNAAASGEGRAVPQTVHEKEMAKRLGAGIEATVIASKR
jgi:hypothetical protein